MASITASRAISLPRVATLDVNEFCETPGRTLAHTGSQHVGQLCHSDLDGREFREDVRPFGKKLFAHAKIPLERVTRKKEARRGERRASAMLTGGGVSFVGSEGLRVSPTSVARPSSSLQELNPPRGGCWMIREEAHGL